MFFGTPSATEMLVQSWKWHFGGMLGARAPSAQNKMRRMTRRVFCAPPSHERALSLREVIFLAA
jgi:hypothetical protein